MLSRKEFWFAVFFFILAVVTAISFIKKGYSSYRVTGVFLFTVIGIAFLRKAIKG